MMEHDGCAGCKYESKKSYDEPCAHCSSNCIDKYQRKTNADSIRSMSDEELAEFLNKFEFCNGYAKGYCNATNCKECAGNNDDTLEWLQSESEE